jgi:glycosyltransferase involved in cell wall biosynthesis
METTSIDYSIVICSYNPDERILKRCLKAISNLNVREITYEIILIDNNSLPALHTLPYIKDFFNTTLNSRSVIETKQGLTLARIRGIEEASGKYIVFFDDDNEPHSDYLVNLKKLHEDHPSVGAWGPGNIWVDFIDGLDPKLNKNAEPYVKEIFQEKHREFITYSNIRDWQGYYPYGTGLCVKYSYLKDYSLKVKQSEYSLLGRKGNSLSSGEDLQIVLFCINESAAAGVSPTLKVNHLIPKERANFNYLKKLVFGTSLSYHISVNEILKEHKIQIMNNSPSANTFRIRALGKYTKALLKNDQVRTLKLIHYIGVVYGGYIAINKSMPKVVIHILNLQGLSSLDLPL